MRLGLISTLMDKKRKGAKAIYDWMVQFDVRTLNVGDLETLSELNCFYEKYNDLMMDDRLEERMDALFEEKGFPALYMLSQSVAQMLQDYAAVAAWPDIIREYPEAELTRQFLTNSIAKHLREGKHCIVFGRSLNGSTPDWHELYSPEDVVTYMFVYRITSAIYMEKNSCVVIMYEKEGKDPAETIVYLNTGDEEGPEIVYQGVKDKRVKFLQPDYPESDHR